MRKKNKQKNISCINEINFRGFIIVTLFMYTRDYYYYNIAVPTLIIYFGNRMFNV